MLDALALGGKMSPDEVAEAQQLLSSHNSLRWNLARSGHRTIGLYACDDDSNTSQPRLPPKIGRQVMLVSLALIEERLRELGVEPEKGLDHECFTCNGSGKQPMS
jgi:hypothetical protein